MDSVIHHLPTFIMEKLIVNHTTVRPDGTRATRLSRERLAKVRPRPMPTFYSDGSFGVDLQINSDRMLRISVDVKPYCVTYSVNELHRRTRNGQSVFLVPPVYRMFQFMARCILTNDAAECQWFGGVEDGFLDLMSQRYPGNPDVRIPPVMSITL